MSQSQTPIYDQLMREFNERRQHVNPLMTVEPVPEIQYVPVSEHIKVEAVADDFRDEEAFEAFDAFRRRAFPSRRNSKISLRKHQAIGMPQLQE